MAAAECPSCHAKVEIGRKPRMGQFVRCFECNTRLQVVWLDPVELDWPEDEYGYDDLDDDDDDW